MDTSSEPSLSIASLPRKGLALGFGTKLILCRYPVEGSHPSPLNSILIEDGQLVRAVAFLKIPDGPLCLVTAGDAKYINVYNIASSRENNPHPMSNEEAAKTHLEKHWTPAYRYGPHSKRITSLVTTENGAIIFADKFGEVYRLCLSWSPEHTIAVVGDAKCPATFLLQHFSIISTMFLTSPVQRAGTARNTGELSSDLCRHLFTCDKDCHVRVSRYPDTYVVEQFLWSRNSQSVVTCVAEIPYVLDEESLEEPSSPVQTKDSPNDAPFHYYAVGCENGSVHFWAARNDLCGNDQADSLKLIATYIPEEGRGPVVAVTHVLCSNTADGRELHARDAPQGVLIAYTNDTALTFIPLFSNLGESHLHPATVQATRVPMPQRPAAMISSDAATAMVVQRDGAVCFYRMSIEETPPPTDREMCSFNGNVKAKVTTLEQPMPFLEAKIRHAVGDHLLSLDLGAQWRSDTVDPRTRKGNRAATESGEDDNDIQKEATDAKESPGEKKGAKKSKTE